MSRAIAYSAKELSWISKNRLLPRKLAHEKFQRKFGRMDVGYDAFKQLCNRKGWLTGRTGQFVRGQKVWNEGKKMPFNPNSARTQFKPGNLPHNTKYLGHERLSKNGYIEISIAEKNPHTGYDRRYVLKHRYLWEEKNGRLAKGMCLKARDGNRANPDPDNWVAIPRGTLLVMNRGAVPNYQTADPEARPAIINLAQLKHARYRATKSRKKSQRAD